MMSRQNCPHLNCDAKIHDSPPGWMVFCDACRGGILSCPDCGCFNRLWAVCCRACGRKGLNRRKAVRKYQPEYFSNQREKSHRFYRHILEAQPQDQWNGALQVADGAVLVFTGRRDSLFDRVRIVHPHTGAPPFDILHQQHMGDVKTTGAARIVSPHLFLASTAGLIRINCAAISGERAFQPQHTAELLPIGCDDIVDLDSERLLLVTRNGSGDRLRLKILDTISQKEIASVEADGENYVLKDGILMTAGARAISFYDVAKGLDKPEHRPDLEMGPLSAASQPVRLNDSLYLLARQPGAEAKTLLKWDLDPLEGQLPKPEAVMGGEDLLRLLPLSDDAYWVADFDGLRVHKTAYDEVLNRFELGNGLYTPVDIAVNSPLAAAAYINRLDAYSIAVVDGLSGQYVFTTPPFFRIYSMQLWGRFLYVLARSKTDGPVEIFGYDMKEKMNAPNL